MPSEASDDDYDDDSLLRAPSSSHDSSDDEHDDRAKSASLVSQMLAAEMSPEGQREGMLNRERILAGLPEKLSDISSDEQQKLLTIDPDSRPGRYVSYWELATMSIAEEHEELLKAGSEVSPELEAAVEWSVRMVRNDEEALEITGDHRRDEARFYEWAEGERARGKSFHTL